MAINHKPPFWRRRSYQVAATVLAVLILAALGANFYLAQTYQPAGAVSEYLTALQGKDAQAAWNVAEVEAPHASIGASLNDLNSLRRALAQGAPDIKAFDVTNSHYAADQTTALVDVSFQTGAGSRQTSFHVVRGSERHFGIYPSWRVVIQPAILNLTLPPAAQTVMVDGQAVQTSGQTMAIALWPLRHRVTFPGTAMLEEQSVAVDLFDSNAAAVAAQPTLTHAGQSQAISAIKSAFAQCVAQTSAAPDGCPQRYEDSFINSGSWRLVGDPSQNVAIAVDKQDNLVATGHYQMVVAYQQSNGTMHAAVAGGFAAQLALGDSDVTVTSIAASAEVSGLQRPTAATDEMIKGIVSKGLAACAAIHAADPPDCPQQFFFPDASILGWTMSGDPLSGATVTFDAGSGAFTVHGSFAMTVTYELTTHPETESSSTTSYDAVLLWDGQNLQLVTISGGYQ